MSASGEDIFSNSGILRDYSRVSGYVEVVTGGDDQGNEEERMSQAVREVEGMELPVAGTYALDVVAYVGGVRGAPHVDQGRGDGSPSSPDRSRSAERPEDSSVNVEIATASVQTRTGRARRAPQERGLLPDRGVPDDHVHQHGRPPTGGTGFELDGDLDDQGRHEAGHVDRRSSSGPARAWTGRRPCWRLAPGPRSTVSEWGINWNMAVETGGFLVSKKVDLEIEVEAHKVA